MATILVVEDSSKNIEIVSRFLKRGRFDVLAPDNAEETLRLADSTPPDAVLMDLALNEWDPPADGLELTRELRKLPAMAQVPIIAVSARSFEHEKEQALAAGCTDFVEKPVNYMELLEKLKELVSV